MVLPVPGCVTVMLFVTTPEVNAPEVVGLMVPAVVLKLTEPMKLVTVLLFESWAVIVTLKPVPAVCGLLIAEIAKWWSGPIIVIVYALLAAQIKPGFAPSRVKLKVPAAVGVPLRLLPLR